MSLAFRNQAHLLGPILSSIKKFSQITRLSIEFLNNVHQETNLQFDQLGKLRKLKSIRLKFDFWPKNFETFLTILENCPLTELYIDAVIDQDSHIIALKDLLNHLNKLDSLTLKIYKTSAFDSDVIFRQLFDRISQIKTLKDLKLQFFASEVQEREKLSSNIVQHLQGVFNKSVKIENFSFHFNQAETRETFQKIINLVERGASILRKLDINVGEYEPKENDYNKIIALIYRLKSIEILKLNSLCVIANTFWQDFIDQIYALKHIKVFEVRQIKGSLSDSVFIGGIEKILEKRGLQKFICRIQFDRKELATSRKRQFRKIDLKEILKKNPDLQSYPEASGLFVYYDDDTEWKWTEEIYA